MARGRTSFDGAEVFAEFASLGSLCGCVSAVERGSREALRKIQRIAQT